MCQPDVGSPPDTIPNPVGATWLGLVADPEVLVPLLGPDPQALVEPWGQ